MMGFGKVRIEFESAQRLLFRVPPVPLTEKIERGERIVGLSDRIVEFHRLPSGVPALLHGWIRRHQAFDHAGNVVIRYTAPGGSVIRLQLDRPFKMLAAVL